MNGFTFKGYKSANFSLFLFSMRFREEFALLKGNLFVKSIAVFEKGFERRASWRPQNYPPPPTKLKIAENPGRVFIHLQSISESSGHMMSK